MIGGMYSVALATDSLQQRQEFVADNLAHINTPGYRRKIGAFQEQVSKHEPGLDVGASGGLKTNTSHDFTPGQFQQTGRSLDVAIDGDGFFELAAPQGPRYTRSGVFFIGQDNQLVTTSGLPVAGTGGPIRMPPNTSPDQVVIGQDGSIRVGGTDVGKLKIAAFEDNQALELDGTAIFMATDKAVPISDPGAVVHQGRRELSNVSATHELIKLITGVRHHDASQKMLRSMSEVLQQRTQAR